ncbi:FCD domain-containing protein [Streptomyces caeni]|uniref:FCD domain-containing protein n=1 Tax=Streptomyces caeni TaxID=2307231 RepID=A0ABW4ITA7_9ACTN
MTDTALDLGPQSRVVARLAAGVCDEQPADVTARPGRPVRTLLGHLPGLAAVFRDAGRKALCRADAAERSLANREFHRALYLPCGNPLLGRMLDEVRDRAALVSAVAWAAEPSWEREAAEHREILRLALEGEADGAASALHTHIASFVQRAFPASGHRGEDGRA